jgi:predicted nuclease with TOPRIM domain
MAQKEIVMNIKLEATDAIQQIKELAVNTGELKDRKKELNDEIKAEERNLKTLEKAYAQGKASADQVTAAEDKLAKVRKQNREEIALLDTALTGQSRRFNELKNDVSGLTDEGLRFRDVLTKAFTEAISPTFAKLADSVGTANREMAAALKTFGAGSAEFKKAADGVQRLETNLAELKTAQNEATTALKQFGESSKEFTEANERLKALEATAAGLADEVAGKVEPKFEALNRQLREARKEAQQAAEEFGFMSNEFKAAAERADDLDDQIKAVNARIGAIDTEGKIETFGKALQGVTGAFSVAQGAAALFGDESEAVEQALLKVQAALAIQQGVSGIIEGAKAARAFAASIGLIAPASAGATAGLRAMSAATIATGIGAIAVAIGLVVTGLMAMKSESDAANKSLQGTIDRNEKIREQTLGLQAKILENDLKLKVLRGEITQGEADRLQLQREFAKTSKEDQKGIDEQVKLRDQLNAKIKENEASIKTLGKSTDAQQKLNAQRLREENESLAIRARAADETAKAGERALADRKEAFEQETAISILTEQNAENKKDEAQATKDAAKATKDAAKDAKELNKSYEEELKIRQEIAQRVVAQENEQLLLTQQLLNEAEDARLKGFQREENAIRDKYFTAITLAEEGSAEQLALIDAQNAEIEAKRKKFDEKEAEDAKTKAEKIIAANQAIADAQFEVDRLRVESAQAVFSALGQLAEEGSQTAKFFFALEKATAIAGVFVNLGQELAQIAANPTWTALPDGGTTIKAAASAAAKIRAGVNVALIAKQVVKGFAEGGYTGSGGKYEPAGIVHRGEYVLPQEVVRALGVQRLDALRSMYTGAAPGRGSYATGGMVQATLSSNAILAAQNAAAANTMNLQPVLPVESLRAVMNRVEVREARATL